MAFLKKIAVAFLLVNLIFSIGGLPVYGARRRRKKKRYQRFEKVSAERAKKKSKVIDLNLDKRITRERISNVRPNLHLLSGCNTCHKKVPPEGYTPPTEDAPAGRKAPLKYEGVDKLCHSCHPRGAEVHPSDLEPSGKLVAKIPSIFPLGRLGKEKGRIVCITCHNVHSEMATSYLLIGMPIRDDSANARYPSLDKFCQSCHERRISQLSPHHGNELEAMCRFCHAISPEKVSNIYLSLSPAITRTCNFCHDSKKDAHYLEVNPFADASIKKDFPNSIPQISGAYTCLTCHYSHKGEGNAYLLRSEYIAFAEKSKLIMPHWTKSFCLSCHENKPQAGKPVDFKFDGDMVKVCTWCHDSVTARGFFHTVQIKPPGIGHKRYYAVRFDSTLFTLSKEGKIDCITCHRRECEQDKEDVGAYFLKGGPYKKEVDVCFKCHVREVFRSTNPHEGQITEDLEPILEKCMFCHMTDPGAVKGVRRINYVRLTRLLCMRCHDEYDHPGSHITTGRGVDHLIQFPKKSDKRYFLKPLKEVPVDVLPLTKNNFITCNTCHNPHQFGLHEGKAAMGAGVRDRHRMDIMKGELCSSCHTF